MRPVGDLVDATLLEEIVLLSDVITTVAGHLDHLDDGEVDEVLGVHLRGLPDATQPTRPRGRSA